MSVPTLQRRDDLSRLTLDELATRANQEYEGGQRSLVSALGHAIACGEILIEAKGRQAGSWAKWCDDNLTFGHKRTHRLIRLATYKNHLPSEAFESWEDRAGKVHGPSMERALVYIRNLPQLPTAPAGIWSGGGDITRQPVADETQLEIRRLRENGLSQHEIAEIVGVSQATVSKYLNPQAYRKARSERARRRTEQRNALRIFRKQQKQVELQGLSKKLGGSLEESYSLLRRLLQQLDYAYSEARDPHVRIHLGSAITRAHEVEDKVGLALRQSATAAEKATNTQGQA